MFMTTASPLHPAGTCPINHPCDACPIPLLPLAAFPLLQKCQFHHHLIKTSPALHLLLKLPTQAHSLSWQKGSVSASISFFYECPPHAPFALTPETVSTWLKFCPHTKLPPGHCYLGILWAFQTPSVQNWSPHLLSKEVPPSPVFQTQ